MHRKWLERIQANSNEERGRIWGGKREILLFFFYKTLLLFAFSQTSIYYFNDFFLEAKRALKCLKCLPGVLAHPGILDVGAVASQVWEGRDTHAQVTARVQGVQEMKTQAAGNASFLRMVGGQEVREGSSLGAGSAGTRTRQGRSPSLPLADLPLSGVV